MPHNVSASSSGREHWAQSIKVWLALLMPEIGMRSLAMAQARGERGFVLGGITLIAVGLSAGAALVWS